MSDVEEMKWVADCMKEGAQKAMEKTFLEEFLRKQGYSLAEVKTLPPEQRRALMIEACKYTSLKLAQVEATLCSPAAST